MSLNSVADEAVLWKALDETLLVFGDLFRKVILHDLNSMNRIDASRGSSHLDMGMISDSLKKHFGFEAYTLIMSRLIVKLQELENGKKIHV
jgi:hypothetical protein